MMSIPLRNAATMLVLACLSIVLLSRADAESNGSDKVVEPIFSFDIELPKTTVPLPDVKLHPLPNPGKRTDTRTGMTENGDIYVGGEGYLWKSTDRGVSWTQDTLPAAGGGGGFGILAGDVFVLAYDAEAAGVVQNTFVMRSTNYGKTWSKPFRLDISPYDFSGGGWCHIYQHPNGTAMMTVTLRHRDKAFEEWDNPQVRGMRDHIFRSTDGGKTWGDRTLLAMHGAETSVLALRGSKKMLAYVRAQRGRLPHDPPNLEEMTGAEKDSGWPVKNGAVAESHDAGRTWTNLRLFDKLGGAPGEIIQTPDGAIAAVWLQRYPHEEAEIRVRITRDEGQTWSKTTYWLMKGTGYPSSVVYPDGTIVTVCENTELNKRGYPVGDRSLVAARWTMPLD